MARKLLILTLATLLIMPQVVFASGGNNPGIQRSEKITGPTFSATIVMDPHNATTPNWPVDPLARGWATVRIKKGPQVSGVVFQVPNDFALVYGCQLDSPIVIDNHPIGSDLTEIRFVNVPLTGWMPPEAIVNLFAGVGMTIDLTNANFIPVITSVENAVCVLPLQSGVLSFDAVIQFKVPQR